MKPIHSNLKTLRESYLRMTQAEFGRVLGLSRNQIDNSERDAEPRSGVLAQLSMNYNLDLTRFLTQELTPFNMNEFVRDAKVAPVSALAESGKEDTHADRGLDQNNLLAWKGEVSILLDRLESDTYGQAAERNTDLDRLRQLTAESYQRLSELYQAQSSILHYVNKVLGNDLGR